MDRRLFLAAAAAPAAARAELSPQTADCLLPDVDAPLPTPPDPRLPDVGPRQRFSADGQAQTWPGCTVISAVRPADALFERLCTVRDRLRADPVARRKLTWMPEQSYHMTVADGVNIAHRGRRDDWPAALPLDVSLAAACRFVAERLAAMPPGDTAPLRMRLDARAAATGLRETGQPRPFILWAPADDAEAERLRRLRERIFAAMGVHHAGEAAYTFHTTLAYPIEWFGAAEAARYDRLYVDALRTLGAGRGVLEFHLPSFCVFESMYRFEPRFTVS